MDWKREAVDKLRGYEAHLRALDSIPLEIERLESAAVSVRSAVTDGTPVSGGGSTREDAMLSNISHRAELGRALEQAAAWVKLVDEALEVLDEEERLVLDRFYIHRGKGNIGRLCEELGLQDERSAYKRKDKALRHFTLALYGITEN